MYRNVIQIHCGDTIISTTYTIMQHTLITYFQIEYSPDISCKQTSLNFLIFRMEFEFYIFHFYSRTVTKCRWTAEGAAYDFEAKGRGSSSCHISCDLRPNDHTLRIFYAKCQTGITFTINSIINHNFNNEFKFSDYLLVQMKHYVR